MSRMVLIPGLMLLVQSLEQALLFFGVPHGVGLFRWGVTRSQDNLEFVDFVNKILRLIKN